MDGGELNKKIAEAKGCVDVEPEDPLCCCDRDENGDRPHGDGSDGWINYLTPAAAFALLAEMVEACDPWGDGIDLGKAQAPLYRVGYSLRDEDSTAATLPEAIALAYLAWKAAQP